MSDFYQNHRRGRKIVLEVSACLVPLRYDYHGRTQHPCCGRENDDYALTGRGPLRQNQAHTETPYLDLTFLDRRSALIPFDRMIPAK